jgi:hypothetical protein
MLKLRFAFAVLFIVLGLVIIGRGFVQMAPLTFILMGALMVALGFVRLRDVRRAMRGSAGAPVSRRR